MLNKVFLANNMKKANHILSKVLPNSSFWDPPLLIFIAVTSYLIIPKGKLEFMDPDREARWFYFDIWKSLLISEKRIRGKLCFSYYVIPDALSIREEYGDEIRKNSKSSEIKRYPLKND